MARYPQFGPMFTIQINGSNLPAALRGAITSLTWTAGIEGSDSVEVTFANQNLQWLDNPLLAVDNGFTLSIGYAPDPLEKVFVGEITGVEPSFPNGAMPTIGTIPLPDPVVTSLVAATNLLIPEPDPIGAALSTLMSLVSYILAPQEAQHSVRTQSGTSDFDFLTAIAKDNGWEVYIDHTQEPKGYVLRFQFL